MDIRALGLGLLVLSCAYYFVPVDNKFTNNKDEDIAQVIFENPLMYALNDKEVTSIVKASNIVRYKNRDEMFNSVVYIKSQFESDYELETLRADFVKKSDDNYFFKDNVNYQRDDFLNIDTSEMYYDDLNRIARNSVPYKGYYYSNKFSGENLDLKLNNGTIKSKNIHFEIDINKGSK